MTSPITDIEIECPKCHSRFISGYRASMNLQLDKFSPQYIEKMSSAVCPECKVTISLDCLVIEKDGTWTVGPAKRAKNSQVTGNVGLYFVCYKLSLLGWNAMPASRNAKGIDIIAYNADCTRTVSLQVKTFSKRDPVPLGASISNLMGDFWVIVNNVKKEPCIFIMTPEEIRDRAHKGEKNEKISYCLQPKAYETDEFKNKWERIESQLAQP